MQKLLVYLAMSVSIAAHAQAAPGVAADGTAAAAQNTAANAAPAQAATGKPARSVEERKRKCTARMYGIAPRGRGAPNWSIYDQCMRETGR